jgi:hypothetical protein
VVIKGPEVEVALADELGEEVAEDTAELLDVFGGIELVELEELAGLAEPVELAGLAVLVELGEEDEVVTGEPIDVLLTDEVEVVLGAELEDDAVKEKVMQEHAELTAETSPLQLLKSVGIADGAVVVPERYSTQNVSASAIKRGSMRFL